MVPKSRTIKGFRPLLEPFMVHYRPVFLESGKKAEESIGRISILRYISGTDDKLQDN